MENEKIAGSLRSENCNFFDNSEIEKPKKYNKRLNNAIASFSEGGETAAIIGRGRTGKENSLVLVENGNFVGFGYFGKKESISNYEEALRFVKTGKETSTVQNLVNSYLQNPRGAKVVVF